MVLKSADGTTLEVRIAGYQYPDLKEDPCGYDQNWLLIALSADAKSEKWSGREPCMTTAESEGLLGWLSGILENGKTAPEFRFIEPEIFFRFKSSEKDVIALDVLLEGTFLPPSRINEKWAFEDGYPVSMRISAGDLRRAVEEWKAEIARFPSRGYNPFKEWKGPMIKIITD